MLYDDIDNEIAVRCIMDIFYVSFKGRFCQLEERTPFGRMEPLLGMVFNVPLLDVIKMAEFH